MTKEKIINGCKFQNGCIEYKDISYLKIMPICAIYELSIACHDKENKCKYYQVYKQLKRLQEENERLKNKKEKELKSLFEEKNILHKIIDRLLENAGYSKDIASAEDFEEVYEDMQIKRNELEEYRKALEEIREIEINAYYSSSLEPVSQIQLMGNIIDGYEQRRIRILYKIDEVLNDN